MLWYLIIPILLVWMFYSAWIEKGEFAILTWPNSLIGWAGMLFGMFVIFIIGGIIASGFAFGIGGILNDAKIWHLKDMSSEKLISIRDKEGIEGKISGGLFLMAVYFESRPYYFYYTEDKNGAIRPDKISISRNIYIHEIENGQEPKFITKQYENNKPWLDLFAITKGGWQYHFYVPKGTVRRELTM